MVLGVALSKSGDTFLIAISDICIRKFKKIVRMFFYVEIIMLNDRLKSAHCEKENNTISE